MKRKSIVRFVVLCLGSVFVVLGALGVIHNLDNGGWIDDLGSFTVGLFLVRYGIKGYVFYDGDEFDSPLFGKKANGGESE